MKLIDEIQIVESVRGNVLINLTNGLADIIDDDIKNNLLQKRYGELDFETIKLLQSRNYVFDSSKTYEDYLKNLISKTNNFEMLEVPNFLFITTYDCNLRCTYCYQRGYEIKKNKNLDINVINDFFEFVQNEIHKKEIVLKRKIENNEISITLMGGEPLMTENKGQIIYFMNKCKNIGYRIDIVTNGMAIKDFIDYLDRNNINSIQITLDGNKEVHDKRRFTVEGKGSYEAILESIRLLLSKKIKTYIRINLDSQNIESLPQLAREISEFFCEDCIPYIFLMEHEGCMGYNHIIDDVVAIKRIDELKKIEPLLENIDVAYIGKELINSIFNDLPFYPATRKCSASKSQYIYDYKRVIYKCWWGIGNEKYKIGSNKNDFSLNDEKWQNRNISNIKECNICKYRFICGGGCASRVANTENLENQKGECRDFTNLYDYIVKETMKNGEI